MARCSATCRGNWLGGTVLVALLSLPEAAPATPAADTVVHAVALIGTPYRYGGSSPQMGFDCSGLVRYVFNAAHGMGLPRRSDEISRVGTPVERDELQPGDLVFFNTLKRAYSHVAIYLGDDRFVHAPADGGRVRVDRLGDRYWRVRYDGARRLPGAGAVPITRQPPPMPFPDEDVVRP